MPLVYHPRVRVGTYLEEWGGGYFVDVRRGHQIVEAVTHLAFDAGWSKATAAMPAISRSLGKQGGLP